VVKELIKEAGEKLKVGGFFAVEIGEGQSEEVKKILEETGFTDIKVYKDLAGIERVVTAKRG